MKAIEFGVPGATVCDFVFFFLFFFAGVIIVLSDLVDYELFTRHQEENVLQRTCENSVPLGL